MRRHLYNVIEHNLESSSSDGVVKGLCFLPKVKAERFAKLYNRYQFGYGKKSFRYYTEKATYEIVCMMSNASNTLNVLDRCIDFI